MRIVHYYMGALRGEFGTGNSVRGWSEALAREGANVSLVVRERDVNLALPDNVEVITLRRKKGLRLWALGSIDLVILHGGWDPGNVRVARSLRRMGIPYVVTVHGVYSPWVLKRTAWRKSVWWRLFERRYLSDARGIHIFFPEEREHLTSKAIDVPTIVAPNGYSAPEGFRWAGQASDDYLLWLGRYDMKGKGLDLLLKALTLIDPQRRPRLRMVGVDWRRNKRDVARVCRQLTLEKWVSIEGPVYGEPKWRLLSNALGFVYPSRWEASPFAVLEATSIGVPTLVTPYALGRFLAERGGVLLAEPDPVSLSVEIEKLLSPKGVTTGSLGAEVVREHLAWDVLARSWLGQARSLMDRRAD